MYPHIIITGHTLSEYKMSSSGNKVPLPGGSYRQPWISSNNNETSNPDNLHEIPLSGLQSGIAEHGAHRPISSGPSASPGAWRASDESSTSTAQRLAELRLEMTSNQKQIQQLAEAHRAVHNAVSGINAMQDLLAVKEHKGDPRKIFPAASPLVTSLGW